MAARVSCSKIEQSRCKESEEGKSKDRYNTAQGKVTKNIGYLAFCFCFLITIQKLKENRLNRKKIAKIAFVYTASIIYYYFINRNSNFAIRNYLFINV